MGVGDVKLAAGVGAALGQLGWQALVAGTFPSDAADRTLF